MPSDLLGPLSYYVLSAPPDQQVLPQPLTLHQTVIATQLQAAQDDTRAAEHHLVQRQNNLKQFEL